MLNFVNKLHLKNWLISFLCASSFCAQAVHASAEQCRIILGKLLAPDSQSSDRHELHRQLEVMVKAKNYVPIQELVTTVNKSVEQSGGKPSPVSTQAITSLAHLLREISRPDMNEPRELAKAALPAMVKLYPNADAATRTQIAKAIEQIALGAPEIVPNLIKDALQVQEAGLALQAQETLLTMPFNDSEVPRASLESIRDGLKSGDPAHQVNAAKLMNNLLQRYQGGEGWKEVRLRTPEVSDLFFAQAVALSKAAERPSHRKGMNDFDRLAATTGEHANNLVAVVQPVLQGNYDSQVYATLAMAVARNPKNATALVPDLIRLLNDSRWASASFYHTPKSDIMSALAAIKDPRAIPEFEKSLQKPDSERLSAGRNLLRWDSSKFVLKVAESITVGTEIGEYAGEAYLVKEIGELGPSAAAVVPHFEKLVMSQKSVSNVKRIIEAIGRIAGKEKAKQVLSSYQESRKANKGGAAKKAPGNRFFVPITEAELYAKVEAAWKKNRNYSPDTSMHLWDLSADIRKDLGKIETEIENAEEVSLGSGKLPNGLSYVAVHVGGDAERPFYFIIYWDGKALRAYIPVEGNTWNTDTGKAYGHDPESDLLNARERFPNEIGEDASEDSLHDLNGDHAAMLADIQQRLVPKP